MYVSCSLFRCSVADRLLPDMEEYGFDVGSKTVRLSIGDYVGVGELEFAEGNLLKAADLFSKGGEMSRAVDIMVGVVWSDLTIGSFDVVDSPRLLESRKLVQKVMRLKVDAIDPRHQISRSSLMFLCDRGLTDSLFRSFHS